MALDAKRKALGMRNVEFAEFLGVHFTSWYRIRRGETETLSGDFLGFVLDKFPSLTDMVLVSLRERD